MLTRTSGTHISPDIILDSGTLPCLRKLKTDVFNLSIFARSHISFSKTLEILHTGVCYLDEAGGFVFAEMYRALEEYGGLPRLKGLTLTFGELPDDLQNAEWIAGLERLCPGVEQFCGDVNVAWVAVSRLVSSLYTRLIQRCSQVYHGRYPDQV